LSVFGANRGIVGVLTAGRASPAEIEAHLWRMVGMLRHRGPDDEGVWTDGRAGLANTRLSIIDLSPAGHQPMASADGQVWIAHNGEIYNFPDIRRELETLGYHFRGRSDTEVVVNGWHAWGPQIFARLRGMFALALWDSRARRLVLARDRLGKKPLFWAATPSGLVFGSEIKALLTWPDLPRLPDLAAIDRYLSLQYVPAPDTAFAAVKKLPAAHYLSVSTTLDGGLSAAELVRYWRLPAALHGTPHRPRAELHDELRTLIEEAVRLRLVADVPLGAFLSGGIDSSTVVAMMARAGGGRVKTFSIGFAAKEYDETRYARMVAERYATEHEEYIVEPDAVAVLPRLVWHYDEPFADPSAIPTYYVAELARRKVAVALTGDGGDECFFGYGRYRAMRYLARLDRLPGWGRTGIAQALAVLPPSLARRFRLPRIHEVLRAPADRPEQRYAPMIAFFSVDDRESGYGEALRGRLGDTPFDLLAPYFAETGELVAGANRADFHTYLPDDLMVKVDVATMAHGLEARSPLLDHVLVEWAAGVPAAVQLAGGVTKALLRSAMATALPRAVLTRPKHGFGIPLDRWFRTDLKEFAYDTLLSRSAVERGLFQPGYVRRLLDEHCSFRRLNHTRLWALLVLELWFRMWIDPPDAAAVLRPAA
jgi:asparagine synthase (glutamine-hydrolysing)